MSIRVPLDRFLGCMLGQAVGDALGAPFEGLPTDFVYWVRGPVHELIGQPPDAVLAYTDDTQMMIGVAETLIERGEIVEDTICERFAANFDDSRGYGQGASQILTAMRDGGDWRDLADHLFPGGSFGNGAAMRVAPVGLFFGPDPARVAEQARLSALPTHRHPLGIEGAVLLAVAVALAAHGPPFDRRGFFDELQRHCVSEEFAWQVRAARKLRRGHALDFLGHSLPAHRSVVTAIACFSTNPDSYERAVAKAIALGDDTDTLAAMAGALCGAHLGLSAVPADWLRRLEGGPKGGDYIRALAEQLHERHGAAATTA